MKHDQLRACLNALETVKLLEERMTVLESRLTRATAILSGMPGGGRRQDTIGEGVAAMEKLRGRWAEAAADWAQRSTAVEEALAALPADLRAVMRLRYIDGMTWAALSERLDRSERWCYVLHNRALAHMKQEPEASAG